MSQRKRSTLLAAAALAGLGFIQSANAAVVINEVYGAGGFTAGSLAASLYNADYFELYNNGTDTVSLSGYVVAYGSATSSAFPTNGSNYVPLSTSASLAPGAYYVLSGATGAGGSTFTADQTSAINASSSSGKLELLNGTTVADLVGYGTANSFEGAAAAPQPTGSTGLVSVSRIVDGVDTNQNATDFALLTPTPGVSNVSTPEPAALGTLAAVGSALMIKRRNKKA